MNNTDDNVSSSIKLGEFVNFVAGLISSGDTARNIIFNDNEAIK